jgi:hypothetical protein
MSRRSFTVLEVEALIPDLESTFSQLLQLRVGLRGFAKKLEAAGVDAEAEAEPTDNEPAEVAQARAMFRGFYEALSERLERIRALGGDVKDLDMGLVDFPGRRGDEDVLLCWRLGEKRIQFWHPVDEGFSGRRPVDEGVLQAPTAVD